MRFDGKPLEFNKIVERIMTYGQTTLGKEQISAMTPSSDVREVTQALNETAEAKRFVEEGLEPRFGGIYDLRDALKRARIEGTLSIDAFLNVASHIIASKRIQKDLNRLESLIGERLSICTYGEQLVICESLLEAIKTVMNDEGEILSSASSALKTIRSQRDSVERKIKTTLDQVLKKEAKKLTESLVTIRFNRYVVPVKLSEKNNLKGTILDYSSSGETAYVEPDSVRVLSSQKERLDADENKEIEKLLYQLTLKVKADSADIQANAVLLAHLDTLFAKAMYAHATESIKPILSDKLSLIHARHPLIPKAEIVANTITFDEGVKIMVITGSNTGGKTVTLKTVGLLAIMAQSGCLIPVSPGSTLMCFNQIRADIGDEQSIEQSLSTFSSHMNNIVDIINKIEPRSLILLDELGSGTDPNEGSSLGMSILNHLSEKDVLIMATTHYPELKAYAYTKPSIVNASVEFDELTLRPTYRLLLRTPGESHALLIAERLGLPKTIIAQAKEQVLTSETEVSQLIDTLKTESKRLDAMLMDYEAKLKVLEKEHKDIIVIKRRLQKEKDTLKEQLTLENQQVLATLKADAEALIKELETLKTQSFKAHELAELKHQTKKLTVDNTKTSQTTDHTYQGGDTVYILKYNRYGTLIEKQKNKQWVVQMGRLNSLFKEKEFEYTETPQEQPKKTVSQTAPLVSKKVSSELDLRGLRVHEAEEELHKYLDDCMVANMPFTTIIHGFGTLALRKMVHAVLSAHTNVKSFRDGKGNEGGQGVSVVYFK